MELMEYTSDSQRGTQAPQGGNLNVMGGNLKMMLIRSNFRFYPINFILRATSGRHYCQKLMLHFLHICYRASGTTYTRHFCLQFYTL